MRCYMSLWTGGTGVDNTPLSAWKLSAALLKKHYGNVTLVTDTLGASRLAGVGFTSVETALDNAVPEYPVYTAGKVYAWRHIAAKGEPFIHVDGDAFVWAPLDARMLAAPIFVQSGDWGFWEHSTSLNIPDYDIDSLCRLSGCVIPPEWQELIASKSHTPVYNTGIFGGSDAALISDFCDYAIGVMENPLYKPMWICQELGDQYLSTDKVKSMMAEQGALGIWLKARGIEPAWIFRNRGDLARDTYGRYTHLMSLKTDPVIRARLDARVAQEPYDLEPRAVPADQWHFVAPLGE